MRRSRVNLSGSHHLGGSGEDSFVAVIVTKLTGALLIILVMTMGIMVLLPQGLASLRRLQILPAGSKVVDLPSATIGEDYRVVFASEGGNEFVDFTLSGGMFPKGLDWLVATHDDILTPAMPGYQTHVGLAGKPLGPPADYEFELTAHSSTTDKDAPELKKEEFVRSSPRKFHLRVAAPPPPRVQVEDLAILTPERIPQTRIGPDGQATVQLMASGGIAPLAWKVEPGSSEPLSVSPDGRLTLPVTAPTEVRFTASVTSAQEDVARWHGKKAAASRSFTWAVLPPEEPVTILTPTELPVVESGKAGYRVALAARGGSGVYTWSLLPTVDGKMPPPFVTIDGSDLVASPPPNESAEQLVYGFRVQVVDGQPKAKPVTHPVRLRVEPKSLFKVSYGDPAADVKIMTKEDLPRGIEGSPYGVMFAAQGGRPPYAWALEGVTRDGATATAPMKPPDLGIDLLAEGWLSGELKTSGTFRIVVAVRDSRSGDASGQTQRRTFLLQVDPLKIDTQSNPLRILTPPGRLPDAVVGTQYNLAFSAAGGAPPYRWSVTGKVPPSFGFKDSSMGFFTGKANGTAAGTHEFSVSLTDRQGSRASQRARVNLTVRPAPQPLTFLADALPDAALNKPYKAPVPVAGGSPPLRYGITQGTLPEGLSFDEQTGLVTGTPSRPTETPVELTVRGASADGQTQEQVLRIAVIPQVESKPLSILTNEVLPPVIVLQKDYQTQLTADGGVPPYNWRQGTPWPERTAGWLKLTPTGRVESAAPFTSPRALQLGIEVSDALGNRQTKVFRLQVRRNAALPLKVTTHEVLPASFTGRVYQLTPAAEGGVPPYRWEVEAGQLPEGIELSSAQMSGKPKKATDTAVKLTLRVLDSQVPPSFASKAVSLEVYEDWKGVLGRWWKYAGFLAIVALHFIAKAVLIDRPTQAKIQELCKKGLTLIQGPGGWQISGPENLQKEFFQLQKKSAAFGKVLLVFSLIGAVIYGVYCFYYLP